jgi:hypothetical protein
MQSKDRTRPVPVVYVATAHQVTLGSMVLSRYLSTRDMLDGSNMEITASAGVVQSVGVPPNV